MPINEFLERPADEGWPPDAEFRFADALALAMQEMNPPREPKRRNYIRPSDALACARKLSYTALGYEGDEIDPSGFFAITLGNLIHGWWQSHQEAHLTAGDEATALAVSVEEEFKMELTLSDGSSVWVFGFADLLVWWFNLAWTIVDAKSTGGYGFKMKIGDRGKPEGPDLAHVLQQGIYGRLLVELGVPAELIELVTAYLSKEAVSLAIAKKKGLTGTERFAAEFTVPYPDYAFQVEAELIRMNKILRMAHDQNTLARRIIPTMPPGGEIEDPTTGHWVQRDHDGEVIDVKSFWGCDYCSFQTQCITDGAGRIVLTESQVALLPPFGGPGAPE